MIGWCRTGFVVHPFLRRERAAMNLIGAEVMAIKAINPVNGKIFAPMMK